MRWNEEYMKAFTYVLHWPEHGKSYYGVRYKNGCRTSDMGTIYFSSSDVVKKFWKENGDPLIIIDQQFLDVDEARAYEAEVNQDNDVRNNHDWLNKIDGMAPYVISGEKHHFYGKKLSEETKAKISESKKGEKNHFYGKKHSKEAKAKISDSKKGEKNHFYGKKHSEETKSKISESQKGEKNHAYGKKLSEEAKAKISEYRKGKKLSEEAKAKISESRKGEKHPRFDHTIYVFKHDDHGIFVGRQNDIRSMYNLHASNLTQLIKGKSKSHIGWAFCGTYNFASELLD